MKKGTSTTTTALSCLFEELYFATPEEKRQSEFPFALERAKISFQSAHLKAREGKSNAEKALTKARSNFDSLDLASILAAKVELQKQENTQKFLEEEYRALFGGSLS